jgi:hypothetical protein
MTGRLFVQQEGGGPRVVLLHGGALVGGKTPIPDELPSVLADGVRAVRAVRILPWEVELPLDELAAVPFPKLVISGNHHPAFEAVCDVLAERLGAQREWVSGAGHSIPHAGAAFNQTLEAFLTQTHARQGVGGLPRDSYVPYCHDAR